jgi:hypothetical protein
MRWGVQRFSGCNDKAILIKIKFSAQIITFPEIPTIPIFNGLIASSMPVWKQQEIKK